MSVSEFEYRITLQQHPDFLEWLDELNLVKDYCYTWRMQAQKLRLENEKLREFNKVMVSREASLVVQHNTIVEGIAKYHKRLKQRIATLEQKIAQDQRSNGSSSGPQ